MMKQYIYNHKEDHFCANCECMISEDEAGYGICFLDTCSCNDSCNVLIKRFVTN